MNQFSMIAVTLLSLAVTAGGVGAQPRLEDRGDAGRPPAPMAEHRDERGGPSHDWHKGDRIARDDWNRGNHVDYRARHLRAPPRGYEWREVDGRYILAAVATGVIADILLNAR